MRQIRVVRICLVWSCIWISNMTPPVRPDTDFVAAYLSKYHPNNQPMVTVKIPQGAGGQPQLAYRNNNPGNLRYAGQAGATQGDSNFARFQTPEQGYQALINQIQLDQRKGMPLGAFIAKYAPPEENDTSAYVQHVARALGINPGTPIDNLSPHELAKVIAQKESGAQVIDLPTVPLPTLGKPQPPAGPGSNHPGSGAMY